jgi:hypothetical protein
VCSVMRAMLPKVTRAHSSSKPCPQLMRAAPPPLQASVPCASPSAHAAAALALKLVTLKCGES